MGSRKGVPAVVNRPAADDRLPPVGTVERLFFRRVGGLVGDICGMHRVSVREVLGPSRSASVVSARNACSYELRKLGFSWTEVGDLLGRTHTTVLLGARRHAQINKLSEV